MICRSGVGVRGLPRSPSAHAHCPTLVLPVLPNAGNGSSGFHSKLINTLSPRWALSCQWLVYSCSDRSTFWWQAITLPIVNYVNPVWCVAIVCHQVGCMHWGHLGHLHRVISHLKWYKIVCMRYLTCTFCQMKYINMFSMYLQSGVPRHFLWRFIAVWT